MLCYHLQAYRFINYKAKNGEVWNGERCCISLDDRIRPDHEEYCRNRLVSESWFKTLDEAIAYAKSLGFDNPELFAN